VSLDNELLDYAQKLFDAAGIGRISNRESVLLLGMESTPQRDLDLFHMKNGVFHITGFAEYIKPGLERITNWLRDRGVDSRIIGKYGYVTGNTPDFFNYKSAVINAGLGKRGKSTLVINEKYGTRLRFAVIGVSARLQPTADNPDMESEYCKSCSLCIDECPVNILEPYRMIVPSRCLSNVTGGIATVKNERVKVCDVCVKKCPANRIGLSS
jgi:Pyruvate/2-oxoacid:ferredoxin oxidoreductase delta subunit